MNQETIIAILMRRDDLCREKAEDILREAREELHALIGEGDTEGAFSVCEEILGLEPDYLEALI